VTRTFVPFALGALLAAGLVVWLWTPGSEEDGPGDLHRAFARAKAYYLNEKNADYQRARLQLEPFADRLRDHLAFHLDMALIDLQEINYLVQDRDWLARERDFVRLLRSALGHLQRADAIDPDNAAVAYNLARTYIKLAPYADDAERKIAQARALLEPLVGMDDPDASALMLYGTLCGDEGDYQQAFWAYSRLVDLGRDFVPQTLFRVGRFKQCDAGKRVPGEDFDKWTEAYEALLEEYPERPKATPDKIERGRYTEFVDLGERPELRPDARALNWRRVTRRAGLPAVGRPAWFAAPDLDLDCSRDLVVNTPDGFRLYRNRRNATFEDLTKDAGLPLDVPIAASAVGDLDNDGRLDLVVGGPGGVRVFLNHTDTDAPTDWRFMEARNEKGEPALADTAAATCLVLWDLDHDGDLDLFAGGDPNRVYRVAVEEPVEGGRWLRFVDVTDRLGMAGPPAAHALMLDVEDDHDVDLLVSSPAGNVWFENRRRLRFERRELPGPAGGSLGAGDLDHDLVEEIRVGGSLFDWKDGAWRAAGANVALVDADSDGTIDADPLAGIELPGELRKLVCSDLNRDDGGTGGRELLALVESKASPSLELYFSQPDRPFAWVDFQPRGRTANRAGIGTRVRVFADDLQVGFTCRDGLVSVGLGPRTVVDAWMMRWTTGVEQGDATPAVNECHAIDEREGEVGSCPFLYAFDGERWHFVNDCHSGTPLGLPVADDTFLPPRSFETILVPGGMLRPAGGNLRLDLAEEFRELFYADRVVLRAIDRPKDARPVLNEAFRVTELPEFRVYALDDLRPPRAATDHRGRDMTAMLSKRDGRHAVVWDRDELDPRFVGLAGEWSITFDFGDLTKAAHPLLVLDGWVEFPTASAVIAASQTGTVAFLPPVLEQQTEDGSWRPLELECGFPAGKGKTVLVDLSGKLLGPGPLRLRSTQRIHWDAFFVSDGARPRPPLKLTEVPLVRAEHRFRGVGRRIDDPEGEQPWRYSHDDLLEFVPYGQLPAGRLTRYGDVRGLLAEQDDRYPVLAAGDVVELTFDPSGLPPLPEGWVRDWCFTTHGWVKDADMNQAVREGVRPLPFRAMSGYPYDESKERHPHPDWVAEWFTREARPLTDPRALFESETPAAAGG